jgi:transporter family-2 protein
MNAGLGRAPGHPAAAVLVLFAVTLTVALVGAAATGAWPAPARLAVAPSLCLAGGLFMVFYIATAPILISRLAVGNTILFVLVGQTTASSAIERFGLLGVAQLPLNLQRLIGLALFLIGLAVAQTSAAQSGK